MMWRLLLITSVLIGQSLCCIQCDRRGKLAMNKFSAILYSQLDENIEEYVNIKRFGKAAEQQVLDYLEDEVKILDDYAISEVVNEYKISVDIIGASDFKGIPLLNIIGLQFQRLKQKFKVIVQDSKKRMCPNKQDADSCGLMVQTYTKCLSCTEERVVCAGGPPKNQAHFDRCTCMCTKNGCFDLKTRSFCSPCKDHKSHLAETINCGERNIQIDEEEDLVLDCSLPWHVRLGESYNTLLVKDLETRERSSDNPSLVIVGVGMEDSGLYKCTSVLNSGVPVSSFVYNVTVISVSGRPTRKYKPRPTAPDELDITVPEPTVPPEEQGINKNALIALCVASSVTIMIIAGICICIFWRIKMKSREPLEKEPV